MADDVKVDANVEAARLHLVGIAESLNDLARSLSALSQSHRRNDAGRSVVSLVSFARKMLADIRQREGQLPAPIFVDPAWKLALDLFVASSDGKAISIGSAIIAAGVPQTTGLRLIAAMVEQGYLIKSPHPFDRRQWHVKPTDELQRRVEEHLTSVADRWGVPTRSPLAARRS